MENLREEIEKIYDDFEEDLRKGYIKALEEKFPDLYGSGKNLGEFAADAKIAYDYWKQMKQTNRKLIDIYGKNVGAAAGTDDYYHPLLQCYLSKISENSRNNGLKLGEWKENYWDIPIKVFVDKKPLNEILADSEKDLKNNAYGSTMGTNNPYVSCLELLDDKRTENMQKSKIW